MAEEVAVTSAAVASSLSSQKLLTGGRVVPPAITALDTVAVELWSDAMLRDMPQDNSLGRSRRVLILMSDTGGGHRASAEVSNVVCNYCNCWHSSIYLLGELVAMFTIFAARPCHHTGYLMLHLCGVQ